MQELIQASTQSSGIAAGHEDIQRPPESKVGHLTDSLGFKPT